MTEARESPRRLLELALDMREDWGREETWNALLAAKNAGWSWKRIYDEVGRLAFRPDSQVRELLDAARATRRPAETGPQVYARGHALALAALEEVQARKQAAPDERETA